MRTLRWIIATTALALVGACVAIETSEPPPSSGVAVENREAENTRLVLAFLDMVFNQHQVAHAFERYVGPTYTQHNPRVPDGPEAAVAGLGNVVAANPGLRHEFVRTVTQGDLVVVHTHETRPGSPDRAIIEIFRVADGRIVEHWDVVQDVPETARNTNTMF